MREKSKNKTEIRDNWRRSFRIYAQTFSKVWYLAFIGIFLLNTFTLNTADDFHMSYTRIIIFVIIVLFYIFLSLVIMHRIYSLVLDRKITITESVIYVSHKCRAAFVCLLSIFLIFCAGTILSLFLFGKVYGMYICLCYAIFVYILFIYAIPYVLFNNKKGLESLKCSAKLTWKNWWKVFVLFIIPIIIFDIVQQAILILIQMNWIGVLLISLVTVLFTPFLYSLLLISFYHFELKNGEESQKF